MKIMYCEYGKRDYERITLQELKYRASWEYKELQEQKIGLFMITFDGVEDGVLYFSEVDAYDYCNGEKFEE